ncbi:acyltransferase 3 [Fructilactobacillus florum 8D]|uniref:Acyltransferase 3 n=1 Tax=Fructilactobacillus florum 8D TaxID=1221538 RepID=W9EIC9_9LACO|nr:acyltransferase [Fructilactobacillus florum]ETO41016.1 acyltransferase 3 [Fructilactobacillus florum 8D]
MEKPKRLVYVDLINVLAIFGVLVIHSSWNKGSASLELSSALLRNIFAPAVFLFIMNSGATLLDYREKYSTKTFLNKRIHRVVLPFVFWSVIYYLVGGFLRNPLPNVNFTVAKPSLLNFLTTFLSGDINGAFWFFYCMITLYLITPILSVLVKDHLNLMFYWVCLDFVVSFLIIYLNNNSWHLTLNQYLFPLNATNYVSFFMMGYLLRVGYFKPVTLKYLAVFGGVSIGIMLLLAGLAVKFNLDPLLANLGSYGGPLLFVYTIGAAVFLQKLGTKLGFFQRRQVQKVLAALSSLSLGVYILHPFFLKLFFVLTGTAYTSWLDLLVMPIFTYVLCGLAVYLLKKIPYVKTILP